MPDQTIKLGLRAIIREKDFKLPLAIKFGELAEASSQLRWHASNILNQHLLQLDTEDLVAEIEYGREYKAQSNDRDYRYSHPDKPRNYIPVVSALNTQMQSFITRTQALMADGSTSHNTGTIIFIHLCKRVHA
jgi:hypothetical protein